MDNNLLNFLLFCVVQSDRDIKNRIGYRYKKNMKLVMILFFPYFILRKGNIDDVIEEEKNLFLIAKLVNIRKNIDNNLQNFVLFCVVQSDKKKE